jgi:predicted aminopeptidase
MVMYGLSQAVGQFSMLYDAQPIEEVLTNSSFPDSLKNKLQLIVEIKQFAVDSLGINPSNNYTKFYNQPNKPKLITMSACEPFSLTPKLWTFPFLGEMPYKGFFNKKKAQQEIQKLKVQGYDIDVYSPSGWSTLGWLNDPVLSSMLYKSEGALANLIIHELTHSTLYVKNNVTFNENLASFIGDKGAEKFLVVKFGEKSKQLIAYEQNKTDEKIFNDYILKGVKRLDSLYSSDIEHQSIEVKKEKKNKLIYEIVLGVNKLQLYSKKKYLNYSLQAFFEKNAFFMSFERYDSQYELFEKEFQGKYKSNLRNYLISLKNTHPSL